MLVPHLKVHYLQISIKPSQLIAIAWGKAIHQVLGVPKVRQAIYRVVCARVVVPTHIMLHHGVHAHGILPIPSRVVGAVAGVCGQVRCRNGVERRGRVHTTRLEEAN